MDLTAGQGAHSKIFEGADAVLGVGAGAVALREHGGVAVGLVAEQGIRARLRIPLDDGDPNRID